MHSSSKISFLKNKKENSLVYFNVFAAVNTENCLIHISSVCYVCGFYHKTCPLSFWELSHQQNSD